MIKKKHFTRKIVSLCLSFAAILSLSPISVMAAADGPGSLTFDCGEGATTCPSRIDFSSNGGSLWKDTVGEKPIPIKPGSQFVDWELVSGNGDVVKPGDLLTQWNSYSVGDINGYAGGNVVVKAVWTPLSSQDSSVPIKLTVPTTSINVTLPTSIDLVFSGEDVKAQVAENFSITNNNNVGNIKISNVKATAKESGWTLTSQSTDSYFQTKPFDSKELYLGFAKDTSYTALSASGFDPGIMIGPVGAGNTQNFKIEAKTGGTSAKVEADLVNLEFTLGYEKKKLEPGLYDENNNLIKSWDELCRAGYFMFIENPDDLGTYSIEIIDNSLSGKLVLGSEVSDISDLSGCTHLTDVVFPDTVTSIASSAFQNCTSLTNLVIPNTVTSIGSDAFLNVPHIIYHGAATGSPWGALSIN